MAVHALDAVVCGGGVADEGELEVYFVRGLGHGWDDEFTEAVTGIRAFGPGCS